MKSFAAAVLAILLVASAVEAQGMIWRHFCGFLYLKSLFLTGFQYNVTIVLAPSSPAQTGRQSIAFNASGQKHNITLSGAPENLVGGYQYGYWAMAPMNVFQISSVDYAWAPSRPGSWAATVNVAKVIITPQYIQDPNMRRANTKAFRGGQARANQRVNFWLKA